jgi:hypothetical protein
MRWSPPRPRRALSCNPSQRSSQHPRNVGAELHLPRVRPGAAAWPSTGDESRLAPTDVLDELVDKARLGIDPQ